MSIRTIRQIVFISLILTFAAVALNNFRLHKMNNVLTAEAIRIINYAEGYKRVHGAFPSNLADYEYSNLDLKDFIAYSKSSDSFNVAFHPCKGKWLCRCVPHWVHRGYKPECGFYFEND